MLKTRVVMSTVCEPVVPYRQRGSFALSPGLLERFLSWKLRHLQWNGARKVPVALRCEFVESCSDVLGQLRQLEKVR